MSIPAVPFSFRLPGEQRMDGSTSITREPKVRGVVRFTGDRLVMEWTGHVRTTVVSGRGTEVTDEPVPAGERALPLGSIARMEVRGGWWMPRIELATVDLASLADVPSAQPGRVTLRLARRDRHHAAELVAKVRMAQADAALRAAEALPGLPPTAGGPQPATQSLHRRARAGRKPGG